MDGGDSYKQCCGNSGLVYGGGKEAPSIILRREFL